MGPYAAAPTRRPLPRALKEPTGRSMSGAPPEDGLPPMAPKGNRRRTRPTTPSPQRRSAGPPKASSGLQQCAEIARPLRPVGPPPPRGGRTISSLRHQGQEAFLVQDSDF